VLGDATATTVSSGFLSLDWAAVAIECRTWLVVLGYCEILVGGGG